MASSGFFRWTRPIALALTIATSGAYAGEGVATMSPGEARLKADVTYLAHDAREGRAPGTAGIEAAADYIATTFKEIGLKPAPGAEGYFQPFNISGQSKLIGSPTLAVKTKADKTLKAENKVDFTPLIFGGSASLKGLPIVFAGYGLSAKDEESKLDYDDYAGIDVKDKVVLVIRKAPRQGQKDGPFSGQKVLRFASFLNKATNAFHHGAAGVVMVNDAAELKGGKDVLLNFQPPGSDQYVKIPFAMITRAFADELLAAAGAPNLETLEKEIDGDLKPHSRLLEGLTLDGSYEIERKELKTKNVIGVLEGSGPLADETIVVGAHYDHLGHGGLTSGSLAFLSRAIHNGADDNASGTALMMELARRMARRPDPLPRRIVFMAFSGEERGLLGSQHYVNHPLFPLNKTVLMLNFDMVGRLSDQSELTIFGIGSTPGLGELVDALGTASGFKIKKVGGMSDGIGGSDHESFYQKDIPVLFAFTGTHKDYHRPSDDTELINFAGMARVADLGEILLLEAARRPARPVFTKVVPKHGAGADPGRVAVSVYFGSIPSYDDSDKGVKLSGVRDGSPAEKAGLKGGDVIVKFGGKPVATIYDYTAALGLFKPDDVVDVVVQRGGKDLTLKVTLGKRPSSE